MLFLIGVYFFYKEMYLVICIWIRLCLVEENIIVLFFNIGKN